jgi:hypothetical protein
VLEPAAFAAHGGVLALAGVAMAALGAGAIRTDYLKWPGGVTIVAGIAILVLVVSGLASASSEASFWVVFWSANAAGVTSLWSALYRGPGTASPEVPQ